MTFAAHKARHDGTDFSFEGRDDAAGILGVFRTNGSAPVATAQSLDELDREARAHLGKEPAAFLYLTDEEGRVYRIMINEKYHAAVERAERRTTITVAILVFCVTCLFAASPASFGGWAVVLFVSATAVYALILRMGLFNAIEAAVVCEILLVLAMVLIPVIRREPSAAAEQNAPADGDRGSGLSRYFVAQRGRRC